MLASAITDFPNSTFKTDKHKLLKSVVVYGANSSGKSNLIKAMDTMRRIVLYSVEKSSVAETQVTPFLLNTTTEKAPSHFEVLFAHNGQHYRYGFEIDKHQVHEEWLFTSLAKSKKEEMLFARVGDAIEVTEKFTEGERLEGKTRTNALFLSVVDQFNGQVAGGIMSWFKDLSPLSGSEHERFRLFTFQMFKKQNQDILKFLRDLDLGFHEVNVREEKFSPKHLPQGLKEEVISEMIESFTDSSIMDITTAHNQYDESGHVVGQKQFELTTQESEGTNKLFNLAGPIFDTLINGGILVIDELDARLHPVLTIAIVKLFNSARYNQKNAQLIFATHDTTLLRYGQFRRDQIYFIEKDKQEASDLYSLLEFKENGQTVRKDRSYEKDYIQGKYGAIPFIGNFDMFILNGQESEN